MFAGQFAFERVVQRSCDAWQSKLSQALGVDLQMEVADPPFATDDLEVKGYWLNPQARTHEQRVKKLKSQVSSALVSLLTEVERKRPRVLVGEGQGGVVVAMAGFPVILERACRDRAVTQHQMETFRIAWSGVTSLVVIDPVILPTSNNFKTVPFELLQDAHPAMSWMQPRNNRRAVIMTSRYLTPPFAEELGVMLGCPAEKDRMPPASLITEALRPPPIYFETDERALQGVCCVCYKKGCLGRCPNPGCGLLMHHTCVEPSPDGSQYCPICRTRSALGAVEREVQESGEYATGDMPFWHEAEVGAPAGRRKSEWKPKRTIRNDELRGPQYPEDRWPTDAEAKHYGLSLIHI